MSAPPRPTFTAHTGAMPALVSDFDWSGTPLGPIDQWPDVMMGIVRFMFSSTLPMCLIVGREGILVYNDGYAEIAGKRHPDILGKGAVEAWPEVASFNEHVISEGFAGRPLRYEDQELVLHRNGEPETVWLNLDYTPVSDASGATIAVLAILSETTKRVLAERALLRTDEQLSFALEASGVVGAWDWDLASDIVTADAFFAEMYGVPVEEARHGTPISRFLDGVHPDDRDMLSQRISGAMEARGNFRAEYRLGDRTGPPRWVMAVGRVVSDEAGQPRRLPGIVVDITERKASEEALAASEAGFRALADSMPQMVWSTRPDGFHDYYNARWYEFTGVPAGSTDGEGWNNMFHPDDQERSRIAWLHSLATGEPYQIEYRLRHRSGEYRWTLGRALPVYDQKGRISRWFGTCTDIHQSKLAAEEREVIAQELSHRIKNIFSVLNGIIALSARSYPAIKPFTDQLRHRISAMGKAHDLVRPHSRASRPVLIEPTLRLLIEQLVAPFQEEDGAPRFTFDGVDTPIDDASATPVALFTHELATNSAKYGALATAEGRVSITGSIVNDDYRIVWKETGGPTIDQPPETDGFGSRLIALSIEGQLGGTLSRVWENDGLRVELSLPIASLSRSSRLRPLQR